MDHSEEEIVDKLSIEQATELRSIFQRCIKKYDKEDLAKLSTRTRKRHRQALSSYYHRLFSVSHRPHPRKSRPSAYIKREEPDKKVLAKIQEMEERVKDLVRRNESLKKENVEMMSALSVKVGKLQGAQEEADFIPRASLPLTDLSAIKEQDVLEWVSQKPTFFEHIATSLQEQGETSRRVNDKLVTLYDIASQSLNRSKAHEAAIASVASNSASGKAAGRSSPKRVAPASQWGYSLQK